MSVDWTTETVLSLTEAASRLPRRRGSKKPHVATLYRWAQRGLRGVRLETIQVGGTLCTSSEALQRFFNRLSNAKRAPFTPSPSLDDRAVSNAIRRLESEGI